MFRRKAASPEGPNGTPPWRPESGNPTPGAPFFRNMPWGTTAPRILDQFLKIS